MAIMYMYMYLQPYMGIRQEISIQYYYFYYYASVLVGEFPDS